MLETWPDGPPEWPTEDYNELMRAKFEELPRINVQKIIENSDNFPIEFPVHNMRCKTLVKNTPEDVLEENINSVYPVVHEHALKLYARFLQHKRTFGSAVEKELYKDMTVDVLVDRLLAKRAAVFVGAHDRFMLMDGVPNLDGAGGWEKIGTPKEKEPLVLKNCISYDEIKLSALLSVSSATRFINVGDRRNSGTVETDPNKIEPNGIIVGLIGARLRRPGVMEHQEMVVTDKDNKNAKKKTSPSTVPELFLDFYEEYPWTYDLQDKDKFTKMKDGVYFNNASFEKRLALSVDTLLIEANSRAKAAGTMAYVHVVGIGLGVWRVAAVQNALFMDTFAKRIEFLGSSTSNLDHIADICFSYIGHPTCGKYKDGDTFILENHGNCGIRIHISNRDPHEKLKEPCEGNLLVVSYAWDGNALPGNEFWMGSLWTSGDPAAACSTQVTELHNPHINPRVSGKNLRVASTKGLLTLEEYQQAVKQMS